MATAYEGQTTTPVERLLTVTDLGTVLQRSRSSVYALVRAGELEPIRLGSRLRFHPDDVRAYIERQRDGAQ